MTIQFILFPAIQPKAQEVFLSLKHGVEARSYDQLGESAKLKPLELELRRLEDLSNAIVQDFAFMRQREVEMRNTNGKSAPFGLPLLKPNLFLCGANGLTNQLMNRAGINKQGQAAQAVHVIVYSGLSSFSRCKQANLLNKPSHFSCFYFHF